MIHIFTVATGIYKELLKEDRILTFNNLFPGVDKTFTFISDSDSLLDLFKTSLEDSYKECNYYHVCNLPYPFINLHKYDYVYDACKMFGYSENDYFLFCDAHSWCLEKSNEYWNKIQNDLVTYDVCYAMNPYRKEDSIFDEIDIRSHNHVKKRELSLHRDYFSQLSFLMGSIGGLRKFKNAINNLLVKDINYTGNQRKKNPILPNFMEQHYANYVFYDILLRGKQYDFTVHNGAYICRTPDNKNDSFIICHHRMDCDVWKKNRLAEYNENV